MGFEFDSPYIGVCLFADICFVIVMGIVSEVIEYER